MEILSVLDGLDQKYLVAEIARPGRRLEEIGCTGEILRRSNKSVIETVHRLAEQPEGIQGIY